MSIQAAPTGSTMHFAFGATGTNTVRPNNFKNSKENTKNSNIFSGNTISFGATGSSMPVFPTEKFPTINPNANKIISNPKTNTTKQMMDIICKTNFYFASGYEPNFETFFERENRYMLQLYLIDKDNEENKDSTLKDYTATDKMYEVLKNSNYLLGSKVIGVLEINNQHVVTFLSYLQQSVTILPKTTFPFDLKSVNQNLIVSLIEVPQPIHKQIIKKLEYFKPKPQENPEEENLEEKNKRDFDFLINCVVNLILSILILSNPAELFLGHLQFYLNDVTYYSDSNNKSEVSPFKLVVSGEIKTTIDKKNEKLQQIAEICEKIRTNGYKSLLPTDVKFLLQYLLKYMADLNYPNPNNISNEDKQPLLHSNSKS